MSTKVTNKGKVMTHQQVRVLMKNELRERFRFKHAVCLDAPGDFVHDRPQNGLEIRLVPGVGNTEHQPVNFCLAQYGLLADLVRYNSKMPHEHAHQSFSEVSFLLNVREFIMVVLQIPRVRMLVVVVGQEPHKAFQGAITLVGVLSASRLIPDRIWGLERTALGGPFPSQEALLFVVVYACLLNAVAVCLLGLIVDSGQIGSCRRTAKIDGRIAIATDVSVNLVFLFLDHDIQSATVGVPVLRIDMGP